MSSVLSSWFYILTLGIASLLLIALVLIFFKPSMFLQLTSASGQLVDLRSMNDYDASNAGTVAATAQLAVIKVGANSYSIANNQTTTLPNPFVAPLPSSGKSAADDVSEAKVTGTFMFWLLMLGIGFLTLLLAFIAVKYPEKLFGPQVSALVRCLPKTKSPCSSSSSCSVSGGCAAPVVGMPGLPVVPAPVIIPKPVIVTPPPAVVVPPEPVTPPAPKPVTPTAAPATSGFTPAQLAILQQIMAAMATKPTTPTA
jgi:hypothetical protein